jgi:hypothetical protein
MTGEGTGVPPSELILGLTVGEWPVAAFTVDSHAIAWVQKDPGRRKLWKCQVVNPIELRYVPPGEARLVARNASTD